MNGHHLTFKPNDNVSKGSPGPLGEKIVTPQRLNCEKSVLNNAENFSQRNNSSVMPYL